MNRHERFMVNGVIAATLCLGSMACGSDPEATSSSTGTGGGSSASSSSGNGGGGDGGAGPASCNAAMLPGPLDQGHWDPRFTIGGFTGHDGLAPTVYDLARDKDGNVLATGRFQWVGRDRVDPLVRYRNGTWEPARSTWELPPPSTGFAAMAEASDGRLALGTYSTLPPKHGEIWVDAGSGLAAVGHFQGAVRSLAWFKGALWVAGNFQLDEGGFAGLAVWDGAAWSGPPGGEVDAPVFELVADADRLLVGGSFDAVGGIPAQRIAEWDGTTWTAHDLTLGPANVYSIARGQGEELFVGGSLFVDPAQGVGGVAHWNGTQWELLGGGVSNGSLPGVVSDMQMHQGKLYVTGCFAYLAGPKTSPAALRAQSLARWTGTAWESLDDGTQYPGTSWFNPSACGDEGPDALWDMAYQRLFSDGNRLYVGGSFPGVSGVPSQSIVAYEADHWVAQGSPERGLAGPVRDFAVGGADCALYALGDTTHAGTTPAPSHVLRYQDGWTAVGGALPADAWCASIAVDGKGRVFLGCTASPSEALPPEARVFELQGNQWVSVGNLQGLESVQDMAFDASGRLWIVGGGATGYVARLDGDELTVVEKGFDGLVYRLALRPGAPGAEPEIVVGGAFTHIGASEHSRVARWDGAAWKPLGAGFTSMVIAVEYGAEAIYASTTDEGSPNRMVLATWDGTSWTELATPARGIAAPMGQSTHTFTSLLARGKSLFAVGYVWPETGGRNVFVYDGDHFESIGGGVPAISVDALALTGDGLWFGGSIAEAGLGSARIPSIGVAHYAWGTTP